MGLQYQSFMSSLKTLRSTISSGLKLMLGSQPIREKLIMTFRRPMEPIIAKDTRFIMTTLAAHPQEVIHAYHKRGQMENFIKEAKLDFGMDTLSHSIFRTNAVKILIRALAYNLINFMKRLLLPKTYQKSRLMTLRIVLIKVAGRLVRSGRGIGLKLSSSFPYLGLFHDLLVQLK